MTAARAAVPPLDTAGSLAVVASLADAVVEEYLPTSTIAILVGHGLPDCGFPLTQPALGDWWRPRVDAAKREEVVEGIWAVALLTFLSGVDYVVRYGVKAWQHTRKPAA